MSADSSLPGASKRLCTRSSDIVAPPVPSPKLPAFTDRLRQTVNSAACCFGLSLGSELGLFTVLNGFEKPASSTAIANEAKLNERYVREWLKLMVVSDILVASTDESSGEDFFFMPLDRREALLSGMSVMASMFFDCVTPAYFPLLDRFQEGGGMPYSLYSHFHKAMNAMSTARYGQTLLSVFVPSVPGLEQRLTEGIDVCDIGCGEGFALILMASKFPRSRFYGYDFNPKCIEVASSRAAEKGLTNITFDVRDAAVLGDDCPQFDYVTTFDSVHDQARPDLCLSEIARILRPDGVYSMVDICSSSHPQNNVNLPAGSLVAACGLAHCMPVSLYFQGGMGLGTLWGWETAVKMLRSAGFAHVEIKPDGIDSLNYHYISAKTSQFPWSS